MDYQNELKEIQAGGNFWKPKAGQFKVKALSELMPTDPYVKKHEGQEDEIHEQIKILISVNEEQKTWTFGKGKTPASTYGQLVDLAVKNNNTLVGKEFTVVVKNDGTKNDYTIV